MDMIIEDFENTGREAAPDSKQRVALGALAVREAGIKYRVLKNKLGQILLDPVKSVPAYEAWVYEDPGRIASIKRGIAQAEAGELMSLDLGPEEDD
jgi:hypothetical protein